MRVRRQRWFIPPIIRMPAGGCRAPVKAILIWAG
jgi:hypothetical protein